jgi:GDP-L-fucose synthase
MTFVLKSKKVLVTGGSGFLGRHVTLELERRGVGQIVAPRSRQVDLTDAQATRRLIEQERPDLVMHLAAQVGGIGANLKKPGSFFRDNMAMGLNVLEEARRAGTEKVVVAGTICAYPKVAPVPFREDDLWNGYPEETNAPYGIAKKALLVMAQAYRAEFGSNFVMLFPVNLYGPHDNFDLETSHVIPAMIRKFASAQARGEQKVVLWGDGSPPASSCTWKTRRAGWSMRPSATTTQTPSTSERASRSRCATWPGRSPPRSATRAR